MLVPSSEANRIKYPERVRVTLVLRRVGGGCKERSRTVTLQDDGSSPLPPLETIMEQILSLLTDSNRR